MNNPKAQALIDGISIVVPVYQSSESLVELCKRIENVLNGEIYEVILVDDGSRYMTWQTIKSLSASNERIIGIRLSRNYGQHSALLAGIRTSRYRYTVTIDDDLQNPPEEIARLKSALEQNNFDIVYGTPEEVSDSTARRIGGKCIRFVLRTLLGVDNAAETSSFRIFHTRLRDGFWEDLGPNISIDAVLSWSSLNTGSITVTHAGRKTGKSNYSMRRLMRFTSDTITGYGIVPLQIATGLGFFAIVFGLFLLFFLLVQRLTVGTSTPGFTLLASLITIFAGIQLLMLGIIGEYLGRMHHRIMRKPSYVVRETTSPTKS
jgi:undecaprenyl-phosphate 4-deoxy-4-formamido-L-arabinose transferase